MSVSEKYDELFEMRRLFPKCGRCGRDLRPFPIASLKLMAERDNRFVCPSECLPVEKSDAA